MSLYQTGNLIVDSHYNIFANRLNAVWGAGSLSSGYGQSDTVPAVSVGTVISASQWATLLARITSAAAHQGTSIASITVPTVGTAIAALTALDGNLVAIDVDRWNAVANGSDITAGGVGTRGTGWNSEITMTYTLTFASANAARYFFNAGGQVRMNFSRAGGTAHAKNTDWTTLCSNCGTVVLTGGAGPATIAGTTYTGTDKIGGSGTPVILQSNLGYYDLTTVNQIVFRQNSSDATYGYGGTGNRIQVEARGNVVVPANIVTVTVRFVDGSPDTSIPSSLDVVDGTLTTNLILRPPSTTYLTNTWGIPTISVNVSGS